MALRHTVQIGANQGIENGRLGKYRNLMNYLSRDSEYIRILHFGTFILNVQYKQLILKVQNRKFLEWSGQGKFYFLVHLFKMSILEKVFGFFAKKKPQKSLKRKTISYIKSPRRKKPKLPKAKSTKTVSFRNRRSEIPCHDVKTDESLEGKTTKKSPRNRVNTT